MKRIVITLLFLIPFLSGCVSVNTNLSINKNKSASVQVSMLSDKEAKPLELATMNANINNFSDNSYKITNNSTNQKVDVLAKKEVKNLFKDDLDLKSLGFATKLPSGRFIDVKHNFFVTSYNINMVYNLKNMQNNIKYVSKISDNENFLNPQYLKYSETASLEMSDNSRADFVANFDQNLLNDVPQEQNSNSKEIVVEDNYKLFDVNNFNSTFSITLPYFASFNNADKVNGTVYTWNINKNGQTQIKLQYVVYSGFSIALMFLAGILFLIYIARRIYRHDTFKRIGNNN